MCLHSTRTSFCLGFRISSHQVPMGHCWQLTLHLLNERFFTTVTRCSELVRETLCRLEIAKCCCEFPLICAIQRRHPQWEVATFQSWVGETVKGANCTICFHMFPCLVGKLFWTFNSIPHVYIMFIHVWREALIYQSPPTRGGNQVNPHVPKWCLPW